MTSEQSSQSHPYLPDAPTHGATAVRVRSASDLFAALREMLSYRDMASLATVTTEDFRLHVPGSDPLMLGGAIDLMRHWMIAFPDLGSTVTDVMAIPSADGTRLTITATVSFKHCGVITLVEGEPILPSGNQVTIQGQIIALARHGYLCEIVISFDLEELTAKLQRGALPGRSSDTDDTAEVRPTVS